MTTEQAWSRADFSCGRCGHRFTAETEADYVRAHSAHLVAHDVAAGLLASPEIRDEVLKLLGLLD
jgi:hypothetical protein